MQTWVKVLIGVVVLGGISTVVYLLIGSGGSGGGSAKVSAPGSGSKAKKPTGPRFYFDWVGSNGNNGNFHILEGLSHVKSSLAEGDQVVIFRPDGSRFKTTTVKRIFSSSAGTILELGVSAQQAKPVSTGAGLSLSERGFVRKLA